MAFIRARTILGVKYYSLVKNYRLTGDPNPKQRQIEWLGIYSEAVEAVKNSVKIPDFQKRRYLLRLDKLEGLDAQKKALQQTPTYQCSCAGWDDIPVKKCRFAPPESKG